MFFRLDTWSFLMPPAVPGTHKLLCKYSVVAGMQSVIDKKAKHERLSADDVIPLLSGNALTQLMHGKMPRTKAFHCCGIHAFWSLSFDGQRECLRNANVFVYPMGTKGELSGKGCVCVDLSGSVYEHEFIENLATHSEPNRPLKRRRIRHKVPREYTGYAMPIHLAADYKAIIPEKHEECRMSRDLECDLYTINCKYGNVPEGLERFDREPKSILTDKLHLISSKETGV